ncbi:beta-alanine-activating enzyme [Condylostylus longicornis]|uniref:beta-alanine-activating enzyme n=1 Tax=Condylostylus longicornis TaxID=2530218 RepID=UPI00244E15D9|nr:beta-alanine-activating enzyme [Condylostylus longicornis]
MDNEDFDSFCSKILNYKTNISLKVYHRTKLEKNFKYAEVLESATYIQNILANLKIPQNSRIGLCVPSRPEIVPIILGILKAKNTFCPIVSKVNLDDLIKNIVKLKADYIILWITIEHSSFTLKRTFKVFGTNFYIYRVHDLGFNSKTKYNYCYCITTSGTTGCPKIIAVPWNCIWSNIKSLSAIYNIKSTDVIIPTSPPTFDPFILDIFLGLNNGASLLFTSNIVHDISIYFQDIFNKNQLGASVMQITPSVFQTFSENTVKFLLFENSSLRILTFGGEPFPHLKYFRNPNGNLKKSPKIKIFNIYGITEVSCWATLHEVNDMNDPFKIPIGKVMDPDTILEVRKCNSIVCTNDKSFGELHIGSKTRKCLIEDENEIEIFEPEKIIFRSTGDIVENLNGEMYYRGRINSIIKRFGHNIDTSVIENKFLEESTIRSVCCIFDETKHELLVFLIAKQNFNPQICLNKLKIVEKPNTIVLSDEFPVNQNGKIAKDVLLRKYRSKTDSFRNFSVLNTFDVVIKHISNISKISSEFLVNLLKCKKTANKKLKTVLNSSFLSLGGTSIDILNLVSEIETLQQRSLDPKIMEMLFDNNCPVSEILNYIENLNESPLQESESEIIEDYSIQTNFLWKFDTKKCIDASPTFHNNYITVGSHSHMLANLNYKSGDIISVLTLPDRIESQVTFYRETDYDHGIVGCYDGYLYKFDPANGLLINKFYSRGMIKSKCLVIEEFVIFGNYGEKENLFCLNRKDLSLKWSLRLGSKGILSSPIKVEENLILVCTLDGTVSSFDIESGEQQWFIKYANPIFSTSTYINELNVILLSEVNGMLHLLSKEGLEQSSFKADGNIFSSFEIQKLDNQIFAYFGCYDCNVYCAKIQQDSIEIIKKIKLQSSIYSTPKSISINDTYFIVSCSSLGIINILDIKLEKVIKKLKLNGEIFSSPLFVDDKLYIGCRDNHLYCIEFRINLPLT